MNEHNERLMSFASVVFLLAVWVIILVWLLTVRLSALDEARERTKPDYVAAFDEAFFERYF